MSESSSCCEFSKSFRVPISMSRRRFLARGAAGLVAGAAIAKAWSGALAAKKDL